MLSLLYREGRLPSAFIWSGGRQVIIYLEGLTEPIIDDEGYYHCLSCGRNLREVHWLRKRFCGIDCEVMFQRQHRNRGEGSWRAFRNRVFQRDNKECVKCGKSLNRRTDFVCDHIYPLFKGGRDWWEDPEMTNFQTLCPECNAEKTGVDFTIPKTLKEKARIVSIARIFDIPENHQLDKFLAIDEKSNAVNSA